MTQKAKNTRKLAAFIELPARTILESAELTVLLLKGVRVYISDMSVDSEAIRVSAARRLHDLGFIAVPHFAARRLTTRANLETAIKMFTQEAGVADVLVIGGDAD